MTEPATMTDDEIDRIVTEIDALMILGKKQIRAGDAKGTVATLQRVEQLALQLPRKKDA
jgi:hypothetical protein